ncbi:MAG: exo-alpha-sialidase [Planctomycetes bacterium]|nr:exo-alpha-sialidase [Planctomycetota bacterium]
MAETARTFHPAITNKEIWPGPDGYPWADTGIRTWTREGVLRRVAPGRLICTWTTGGFTEPTTGNFTMITRSENDGETWSKPEVLFQHPTRGLFTTELFIPNENEVHAFLQTYPHGSWMCHLHSYRAVSLDGGTTWNGPHSIPGGIENVWVNQGIVHSSGRWIIPVSWAELIGDEWAEPSVGRPPAECIVAGQPVKQVQLPYGADSMLSQKAGNAWADRNHRYVCGSILSDDGGNTFRLRGTIRGGKHGWLIEPKVVELSDGRIVMLIRSQRDGWLWRSDSEDGGETWSEAVQTDIPNPSAKVKLLKSQDGRIFLIHNPVNSDGAIMAGRNPLSLWVSDDDMETWKVRADLVKDPNPKASLNYPDGYVDEERGELHFAWEDGRSVFLVRAPMGIG